MPLAHESRQHALRPLALPTPFCGAKIAVSILASTAEPPRRLSSFLLFGGNCSYEAGESYRESTGEEERERKREIAREREAKMRREREKVRGRASVRKRQTEILHFSLLKI